MRGTRCLASLVPSWVRPRVPRDGQQFGSRGQGLGIPDLFLGAVRPGALVRCLWERELMVDRCLRGPVHLLVL